jgi:pyruvate dehydrogenase E2 component (dihydrolipoamide acetyltransferase)
MPINILMPALSPTMTEGTLSRWMVKEGDIIKSGKVLAEIETDKATMEVEAVDEGTIGKILINGGTNNVAVGAVVAVLLEKGESDKDLAAHLKTITKVEKKVEVAVATAPAAAPKAAPTATATPSYAATKAPATPLAQAVAGNSGVDLSKIKGTGNKGQVTKEDVDNHLRFGAGGTSVSRNPLEFTSKENSQMRRTIARRLTESKQTVPHFYLSVDVAMDNLISVREQLNKVGEKRGIKISVNDMIIKACGLALADNPAANSSFYDDATVFYNNCDVSVAVAIEGGLITPIVQNADQKSLPAISSEMKELVKKAKDGKLQPHEYTGGGFSISNLGMFGIDSFVAIVNPPQASILAVGTTRKSEGKSVMTITLSADHRSLDGAVAAQFLGSIRFYLENAAAL